MTVMTFSRSLVQRLGHRQTTFSEDSYNFRQMYIDLRFAVEDHLVQTENINIMKTSSSAIAERPRCRVG